MFDFSLAVFSKNLPEEDGHNEIDWIVEENGVRICSSCDDRRAQAHLSLQSSIIASAAMNWEECEPVLGGIL